MAWVVAYPTLVKVHTTVMRPTVSHIPVDIIPEYPEEAKLWLVGGAPIGGTVCELGDCAPMPIPREDDRLCHITQCIYIIN